MRLFKLLATMGMATMFLGLAAACSSDDSTPAGTGTVDCNSACAKCGAGKANCVSDCNAVMKSACGKEYGALINCQVSNNCNAANCSAQTKAFSECFAQPQDGGTGGGGQGGSGQGGQGGDAGQGGGTAGQGGGTAGQGGGTAGQGGGTAGTGGGGNFTEPPESCMKAGVLSNECNPITNEPCKDTAGAACDWGQEGFVCYPDGNTVDEGGACGESVGYCKGGMGCSSADPDASTGVCEKYCCSDADCTAPKTCKPIEATQLGTFGQCG